MADFKALKAKIDIVAVLTQRGLKLTQKGVNLFALCPFHKEETPSLSVDPRRQLWSCFGCGRGGDVFSLVQQLDHVSFADAVKSLCKDEIHAKDLGELKAQREAMSPMPLERLAPMAADWLLKHWHEKLSGGEKGRLYLESRGLWVPELLRTFRIGYSSGDLPRTVPGKVSMRQALRDTRILNSRGNEFFFGRIVVPLFSASGALVNVYGRAIEPESEIPHLYLPGPRRGVFNRAALTEADTVILTESILDALSVIALGFPHTTTSFGVRGFTGDHLALFQQAKVRRVYCAYDADTAGDDAAAELARDLGTHGIEVLRVRLPVKDANDLLKAGGTRADFQKLLDQARPVEAQPANPTLLPAERPASEAVPASPNIPATSDPTLEPGVSVLSFGPRTYEVTRLPGSPVGLRVRLRLRHEGRTFIDTINLYSDRGRTGAIARLAQLFGTFATKDQVQADLFAIIDALERQSRGEAKPAAGETLEMAENERAEAQAFLECRDLAARIKTDLTDLGVVGEDRSKLLAYLVATSRGLRKPLSLVVISRSSAGKSFLVSKTSDLMPPDDVLAYTRMSAKALFHDEPDRLKHKLLTIEEAQGMEDAAYALRVMQSNQMLKTLSTITDPTTGRHKAQENVVHGPVALIVTTTRELDFETVSRAFVISVDESVEQTERIHEMQRSLRTLEGLGRRVRHDAISRRHHNAQRLLKPLFVVNPFAPRLTFPSGTLRLRREQEKYLTLIDTITYLFQHQRTQGVYREENLELPYVETAPPDIDLANELVVASLRQAFEEITTPSRELLGAIRKLVTQRADGSALLEVRFSRRELREYTGWSDYQVRIHLKQLEELEYVQAVSGSFGKQYAYTLSPDHRLAVAGASDLDQEIRELGLTRSKDLEDKGPRALSEKIQANGRQS